MWNTAASAQTNKSPDSEDIRRSLFQFTRDKGTRDCCPAVANQIYYEGTITKFAGSVGDELYQEIAGIFVLNQPSGADRVIISLPCKITWRYESDSTFRKHYGSWNLCGSEQDNLVCSPGFLSMPLRETIWLASGCAVFFSFQSNQ
jgi:hypothetical protein